MKICCGCELCSLVTLPTYELHIRAGLGWCSCRKLNVRFRWVKLAVFVVEARIHQGFIDVMCEPSSRLRLQEHTDTLLEHASWMCIKSAEKNSSDIKSHIRVSITGPMSLASSNWFEGR